MLLLVVIVILTSIIDATLSSEEERYEQCVKESVEILNNEDWTIEKLYNPTGKWCFLDQEHPLPVDCQFNFNWETD
tara:strand:- start:1957 stop:2184 length:228 start_codon:yes stop_codon:yes gene_type:complete